MRRLLSIALLCCGLAHAAAFTFIQEAHADGSGVTTLAYGSNTTAGSLLIAAFSGSASPPTGLTDTQGNTWRKCCFNTVSVQTTIWYAIGTVGGANTVTFTGSQTGANSFKALLEYSAPASYSIAAGSNNNVSGSVTTLSTVGGIKLLNETLAIVYIVDFTNGQTFTSSDLNLRISVNQAAGIGVAVGEKEVASIAIGTTYAINWTGGATSVNLVMFLATADFSTGGGQRSTAIAQ